MDRPLFLMWEFLGGINDQEACFMKGETAKRNAWVACPKCGHKVAKVRTCDMEVKCRHCGHEYEVVIASCSSMALREESPAYSAASLKTGT
jgi:DNA-directed RNA polymerase subunit RPC12/RpoP